MLSDASTDKWGDGVILYVKYIKYTRVRCFLSVIPPENAIGNEYLIATATEIKNTDFLPECLLATWHIQGVTGGKDQTSGGCSLC